MGEGTLESLTPSEKFQIVRRHIVSGATVLAADVTTGPVVTLGGESIDLIKTDQGGVQISYGGNLINVVVADVMASNDDLADLNDLNSLLYLKNIKYFLSCTDAIC